MAAKQLFEPIRIGIMPEPIKINTKQQQTDTIPACCCRYEYPLVGVEL